MLHVTYQHIGYAVDIGMAAVRVILRDHLKVRKVNARWVPHSLTDEQKQERVNWCKNMLKKYKNGHSKRVWDIVTGDETWLYFFEPKTKQKSATWIGENDARPTKVKQSKSAGKRMFALFFRKAGFVSKMMLKPKRTVTAHYYTRVVLSSLIRRIKKLRPRSGTDGVFCITIMHLRIKQNQL
jgi:histone-lysine N-methyltransferase SETMAR